MHVFHIKGISGVILLLLAVIAAVAVALVLPASFMMVLWNAVLFEGLRKAPEISIYQGFLLWGVLMVLIKLIFNPEIKFQFQPLQGSKPAAKDKPAPTQQKKAEEESKAATSKLEEADNQN